MSSCLQSHFHNTQASSGNRCSVWSLVLPQDLTKQLDEVTQNSEIVEIRQKEAECELEAARDRVQQQATEILLKASKTKSPLFLSSLRFPFLSSSSPLLSFLTHLLPSSLLHLLSSLPPLLSSRLSSPLIPSHFPLPSCFLHHHLQQRVFGFHMQTHQTYSHRSTALVSGVVALNTLMALCCTSLLMSSSPLLKRKKKLATCLLTSLTAGSTPCCANLSRVRNSLKYHGKHSFI